MKREPKLTDSSWTTDEAGAIENPDFHDGSVRGIMTPTNRKLILTCTDGVEGDSYELLIPNVMDLAVEDFKLGNIIFNISVFARDNCPANVIERLRGSQDFGDKEKLL